MVAVAHVIPGHTSKHDSVVDLVRARALLRVGVDVLIPRTGIVSTVVQKRGRTEAMFDFETPCPCLCAIGGPNKLGVPDISNPHVQNPIIRRPLAFALFAPSPILSPVALRMFVPRWSGGCP